MTHETEIDLMTSRAIPRLLALLALLLTAPIALAQQQVPPPVNAFNQPAQPLLVQPAQQTQVAVPVPPAMPSYGYYPGYPYYPNYYPYSRTGAALNGVANVTSATGQYYQQVQQARQTNEQVFSAQIDNRRKLLEERRYEKSLIPDPEDVRMQDKARELRRARSDPPSVEVWDGSAFNALLNNIQRIQLSGLRGPAIPLDPDQVKLLNLSTGVTSGNVGMLRDGGVFQWPLMLKSKRFEGERKKIDELGPRIVKEATSGEISAETLTAFGDAITILREAVDAAVQDLTPTQFVQASRFVNELKGTWRALQDPNVANQFNGKYQARGNTVAELVEMMTKNGLKFAAASPPGRPAYTAIYYSLNAYDLALSQLVSR
jgi:hypothetical protein